MKLWIKYFLLGAICFWMPGVILTPILRDDLGLIGLGLFTMFPLISLFSAYWLVSRSKNLAAASPSVAVYMLLGIYILGAWFMELGGTFVGAGFHGLSRHDLWFLLLCFVPVVTWLMAGPQLYALLFVTLFLVFAHFKWERGRPLPLYDWHKKTKLNAPLP